MKLDQQGDAPHMLSSYLSCPKCGENDYHISHSRSVLEKMRTSILHQRPYRCHSCNYRGWVTLKFTLPKITFKKVSFYFFIFIISIILGYFIGNALN